MQFSRIDSEKVLNLDEFMQKYSSLLEDGKEIPNEKISEVFNNALNSIIEEKDDKEYRCKFAIHRIYFSYLCLDKDSTKNHHDIGQVMPIIRNVIFLSEYWDFEDMNQQAICEECYKEINKYNDLPEIIPEHYKVDHITDIRFHLQKLSEYAKEDPEFMTYINTLKGVY